MSENLATKLAWLATKVKAKEYSDSSASSSTEMNSYFQTSSTNRQCVGLKIAKRRRSHQVPGMMDDMEKCAKRMKFMSLEQKVDPEIIKGQWQPIVLDDGYDGDCDEY